MPRSSLSRTGHFCCISCLHKMMNTYHYEHLNTLNMPNELVMKQKTMNLTQDLPFQNHHLPTSRTGQSGLTNYFFSLRVTLLFYMATKPKKFIYSETTILFCINHLLTQISIPISSVKIMPGKCTHFI